MAARRRLLMAWVPMILVAQGLQAQDANVPPADVSSDASAPSAAATLQEVVVTAQKRAQNLQKVPIAITAFTAQALENMGTTDIHSISNLVPNVNLDAGAPFSGSTSVLSASIRGIGQDDFAFNLDPGVGVYVDGVYLARTVGAVLASRGAY